MILNFISLKFRRKFNYKLKNDELPFLNKSIISFLKNEKLNIGMGVRYMGEPLTEYIKKGEKVLTL